MHASAVRRRVGPVPFLVSAALSVLTACAGARTAESAPDSANPAGESAQNAAPSDPARDLATARDKLDVAKLQLALAERRAETMRLRKEKELELGRAELAQFDASDAPNRLAKSKLELARQRDELAEQQEELAQLEMMYEQQDLADKTREIVLQRGKRRVERAKEELAIAERDATALETRTLPRERGKLALEVEIKGRELEESKGDSEATLLEKRIAVRTAEGEVRTAEAKAAGAKATP